MRVRGGGKTLNRNSRIYSKQ